MAAIRPIEDIASKWANVTPQRAGDYEKGAQNPLTDWKTATTAANPNWKAGVALASTEDRFAKAVGRSSTGVWQQGVLTKGVQRWGPGVQLAQAAFSSAFAPFAAAIRALTLPPRFARRDPRNLDRVRAVVDAMLAVARGRGG